MRVLLVGGRQVLKKGVSAAQGDGRERDRGIVARTAAGEAGLERRGRHGAVCVAPSGRRLVGLCGDELPAQVADLVTHAGRVLEAQLLGGREHLLLELDDRLLEI